MVYTWNEVTKSKGYLSQRAYERQEALVRYIYINGCLPAKFTAPAKPHANISANNTKDTFLAKFLFLN